MAVSRRVRAAEGLFRSIQYGKQQVNFGFTHACQTFFVFIFSYLDWNEQLACQGSQRQPTHNTKTSCTTHRREPTVPWTGLVDPCALVEGFLRPNSWSSFLRIASSFRVCLLRASSEADIPSGVPGAVLLEGEGIVVRFIVGAPTDDPAVDFWYPEFLSMLAFSKSSTGVVSVYLLGGGLGAVVRDSVPGLLK